MIVLVDEFYGISYFQGGVYIQRSLFTIKINANGVVAMDAISSKTFFYHVNGVPFNTCNGYLLIVKKMGVVYERKDVVC